VGLLDSLAENVVKVPLESTEKDEAIRELIEVLVRAGYVSDRTAALAAVEKREAQCSTGIGNGLGLPHGKDASITKLSVAVGTSPTGIDFDSMDGEPVHMVFLILSEANNPGPHVRCLAEVASLMKAGGIAKELSQAKNAHDLIDRLANRSEALADAP
jgi:mannitol/fructose-specific phosphotransferase system IIA component (Ntr-type)